MKNLILILFVFFLTNCVKNNYVYWCADHQCVNEKERIAYFKKTMIVEIRDTNNDNKKDKALKKKILKEQKLDQRKTKERVKQLKKQAKLEEKMKKKERNNNQIKSTKRKLIKHRKINKISEDSKVAVKPIISNPNDFDEILNAVINSNKDKPFPDINNFPE